MEALHDCGGVNKVSSAQRAQQVGVQLADAQTRLPLGVRHLGAASAPPPGAPPGTHQKQYGKIFFSQ